MTYPPPLSGKDKNSFAYVTIKDRLPTILGKVIDFVYRSWKGFRQKYGKEAEDDISLINAALSKLHYQMQTNKPLEKFTDKKPDCQMWNKAFDDLVKLENSPLSWYESPWLFVENYMYRKMNESFFKSKYLNGFDPFSEIKFHSFKSSLAAILSLCEYVHKIDEAGWDKIENMEELFHKIFKVCLWGNKYDLSISNMSVSKAVEDPLSNLDSYDPFIMRNDTQFVYNHLNKYRLELENPKMLEGLENGPVQKVELPPKHRILNVVLDNCGFELFTDLLLVYFLLKANFADRVILRGKMMPWYVSDTTARDLVTLLEWLAKGSAEPEDHSVYNNFQVERESSKNNDGENCHLHQQGEQHTDKHNPHHDTSIIKHAKEYGKWFAKEFTKLMEDNVTERKTTTHEVYKVDTLTSAIEYKDSWYWTLPYDFDAMQTIDPELYQELTQSILIIFKGDLNYRKLIGDLTWDYTTPFREALRRFHPAPLVAMRTNKSDLIAGLAPEISEIAQKTYPKNWMISGDYAIIEFDK